MVKPRTLILKSYSSVGERLFLISKCGRNRPHLTREIASSVEPVDTCSNYISFPSASLNPGNVYQEKKLQREMGFYLDGILREEAKADHDFKHN